MVEGSLARAVGLEGRVMVGREEICQLSSMLASLNLGSLVQAVGVAAQGTDGSVGLSCTAPPWMSDSCRQPRP